MRRTTVISLIVAALMVLGAGGVRWMHERNDDSGRVVKVGFVYEGDESAPYTYSFIRCQRALKSHFGDHVDIAVRSNVAEERGEEALQSLVGEGCELIFSTSYGYEDAAKNIARQYPEVQFCQATGDNANTDPTYDNYHTFMGEIYQGRYVSGIVAGMKLAEMLEEGVIGADQAVVGYVAAYPYSEVISGYTAFLLGVRSVVPTATMIVRYINTWSSYVLERECAERLVDDGCVILSQHSDTVGPSVVCEGSKKPYPVYSVGYNQSMLDVAPTTSLASTRVNWTPYLISAVEAVTYHERIESHVKANTYGNDAAAGFERDWVQIVELNTPVLAEGTEEAVATAIGALSRDDLVVYQGSYTGTNPNDPSDTIDLSAGYRENEGSSSPQFHYVLDDVIEVRK